MLRCSTFDILEQRISRTVVSTEADLSAIHCARPIQSPIVVIVSRLPHSIAISEPSLSQSWGLVVACDDILRVTQLGDVVGNACFGESKQYCSQCC